MSRLPETPTHGRERNAARNQRLMDSPQHRRAPQQASIQLGSAAADPFRNTGTGSGGGLQREVANLEAIPGADMPARSTRSGRVRTDTAFNCALAAMTGMAYGSIATDGYGDADDPETVDEALAGPHAGDWRAALDKEHANLVKHGVYEWAHAPEGQLLLDSKTVLRVKRGTQGEVKSFKARCCARGFTQVPGLHFDPLQARASVVRFETLRVILSIAATNGSAMRQFDVTSAYLHRPLREIIYMHAPPGLEHPTDPTLVWRLLKPLYGTIQGGDYWAEERDEFMVDELGWRKLIRDAAVYLKEWDNNDIAIVGFWVDDVTSCGKSKRLLELEAAFNQKYGISGQGDLEWSLGMKFVRDLDAGTSTLSQEAYIISMMRRFGLEDAKSVTTPFAPGTVLTADMSPMTDDEHKNMHNVPY